MDYKTFTSNLSNLKRYKSLKNETEEKLELLLYDMTGVKGISYDKMPSSFNPSLVALKRLEMIEKYNYLQREHDFIIKAIDHVENTLNKIPDELRQMLIEVYVKGMTYKAVGERHGYSDHGLWLLMRRETEKYL